MREHENMSKINFNSTNEAGQIRAADNKRAVPGKESQATKNKTVVEDKTRFSERATKVGALVDKVKEIPDIRFDRVEALRNQIATNQYQPSSSDIADAILKDEK